MRGFSRQISTTRDDPGPPCAGGVRSPIRVHPDPARFAGEEWLGYYCGFSYESCGRAPRQRADFSGPRGRPGCPVDFVLLVGDGPEDPQLVRLQKLTLGYDRGQDRIRLAGEADVEGQLVLWLTRRFTGLLLKNMRTLLGRTSAQVQSAPLEHRDDVMQMEHQQAVQAARHQGSGSSSTAVRPGIDAIEYLVTRAELNPLRGGGVLLELAGTDRSPVSLPLSRMECHQFLAALSRNAQQAEWALDEAAAWLEEGQPQGRRFS